MSNESVFKINSIKTVGVLSYNLATNTDCSICRYNINSDSIFAQENCTKSVLRVGMCGHCFHLECIIPWERQNGHCPLCSKKWQVKRDIE